MDETPERQDPRALPEGVPPVWAMCDRRGRPVNRHRFTGGMRHDGALWCLVCHRWEDLGGEEFRGP